MIVSRLFRVLFVGVLLLICGAALAQVPRSMNYQGRLTDIAGVPVINGDYSIVFRIYGVADGGAAFWTSDRITVPVVDGLFSVRLGPFPGNMFSSDSSRWLGITVEGDAEISPRTQLRSVPYAFYAKEAELSRPIMWSGGCSSHGQSPGLVTYCTDVEDFNTAEGYLTVTSGGTFTVETAGYYRINAWTANLSTTAAHVTIFKNGSPIHENSYNTQDDWVTVTADVTWYFGEGDTFFVAYYSNSGDYNYYSYDGSCCYSRLQVTFVGP